MNAEVKSSMEVQAMEGAVKSEWVGRPRQSAAEDQGGQQIWGLWQDFQLQHLSDVKLWPQGRGDRGIQSELGTVRILKSRPTRTLKMMHGTMVLVDSDENTRVMEAEDDQAEVEERKIGRDSSLEFQIEPEETARSVRIPSIGSERVCCFSEGSCHAKRRPSCRPPPKLLVLV